MISAKEAIERLCLLQGRVHSHLDNNSAADCFCGGNGFWGSDDYDGTVQGGYRNDEEAIRFIEEAVAEKMKKDT